MRPISNYHRAAILVILLIVGLLIAFANVRQTSSDPRATLLVSESILTRGTIRLDHYGKEALQIYGFAVHEKNGHLYYYFPLGTSVASLPFVAVAQGTGLNMLKHEHVVQIVIASITSALTLLCLIQLARLFIGPTGSILAGSVFWFGSSLASTSGTALWSHNFATLFALGVIYLAIRMTRDGQLRLWPAISVLLFGAYLCRPTMSLLTPLVLLFLFTYHKAAAIKSTALLAGLMGGFIAFSFYEFGQILPDYYLPKRLSGGHFYTAAYGNLLSPARGLFVYSPFILAAWLCLPFSNKKWRLKKSWLLIGLAWPLLHLVVISRFPYWWAGGSFGPRLMTDIIPGLFLLTLYTWPTAAKGRAGALAVVALAMTSVFAIWVHSSQGLYNRYTTIWNSDPLVDHHRELLFDWTYPQFLANRKGHEDRSIKYARAHLLTIHSGEQIPSDAKSIGFVGWSPAEPSLRWTEGNSSSIVFIADTSRAAFEGELTMNGHPMGKQRLSLFLNEVNIYSGELTPNRGKVTVHFPPSLIRNGENWLRLELPDARSPSILDPRNLGLALETISIR